ncbi:MAG TPA: branched-chain amino acid transaminase [Thermoanaerobaculia bacterium]
MSFDEVRSVWWNGDLVPWTKANVHVSAHALHYGSGVFEGIRCYETPEGPAVFRLTEHIDRLFASASAHGIDMPFTASELGAAVCQTVAANGFQRCYVRPIAFFGSSTLALNPGTCPVEAAVLAWPWPAMLGERALDYGVRITVSPWRKFGAEMMPTTAKACGQYINSILAVRDAARRGYDEALLLDAGGGVAEGSGENLFVVHDGVVRTNDDRHSILMGITRDSVMTIARGLGLPVETRALTVEDLLIADEAFFTGTAAEVAPISEVDGVEIGNGRPGEITRRIQQAFFDATSGRSKQYRRWLHFVDACTFAGAYSSVPFI